MAGKNKPPSRPCSCGKGVIKLPKSKCCKKCGRLEYKRVHEQIHDRIVRAKERRRIGEPSQEMPGL